MSQRTFLYQLQTIDREIDLINDRISAIDHTISGDKEIIRAKQTVEIAQKLFNTSKTGLVEIENQVSKHRKKIEQSETRLYSGNVTNPKELQDLQAEIKSIKNRIAALEDEQLEAMMELESSEAELNLAKKTQEEIIKNKEQNNSDLLIEKKDLEIDLEQYLKQRTTTTSLISPHLLEKYMKLRINRNKVAVALLEDNSCSACGNNLTSADGSHRR